MRTLYYLVTSGVTADREAEDQWAAATLRGGPQVSHPHHPIISRGLLSPRLSVVGLPDSSAPSESTPWLGRLPLAPGCPPPTQMPLLCCYGRVWLWEEIEVTEVAGFSQLIAFLDYTSHRSTFLSPYLSSPLACHFSLSKQCIALESLALFSFREVCINPRVIIANGRNGERHGIAVCSPHQGLSLKGVVPGAGSWPRVPVHPVPGAARQPVPSSQPPYFTRFHPHINR